MSNATNLKTEKTSKEKADAGHIVKENTLYDTADKSAANLYDAINAASKKLSTLQVEYQRLALSVMKHLAAHEDIRVLRHLFETMNKSMANTTSMQKFFDLYSNVQFDQKGEVHISKDKPVQLGVAMTKAWWKAKPPTPYAPFVLTAEIKKLYEKAVKKLEDQEPEKGDAIDLEVLNALGKLYETQAESVIDVTEVLDKVA